MENLNKCKFICQYGRLYSPGSKFTAYSGPR